MTHGRHGRQWINSLLYTKEMLCGWSPLEADQFIIGRFEATHRRKILSQQRSRPRDYAQLAPEVAMGELLAIRASGYSGPITSCSMTGLATG